jgi:hypothetical protein
MFGDLRYRRKAGHRLKEPGRAGRERLGPGGLSVGEEDGVEPAAFGGLRQALPPGDVA